MTQPWVRATDSVPDVNMKLILETEPWWSVDTSLFPYVSSAAGFASRVFLFFPKGYHAKAPPQLPGQDLRSAQTFGEEKEAGWGNEALIPGSGDPRKITRPSTPSMEVGAGGSFLKQTH